jgi:hypothetical protein
MLNGTTQQMAMRWAQNVCQAASKSLAVLMSRFSNLFILPLFPSTNQQELLLLLDSAKTTGPQTSLPKQC